MSEQLDNQTFPHISLLYCLDRTFMNKTLGGPDFVYGRVVVDVILTVSLIMANITLIIAIFKYRRRYRGTTRVYNSGISMKFVQLLAFSDVLVGLTMPVYLIPHYFCDINDLMRGNMYVCMTKFVLATFSGVMSNMSLLSIAVDRYLAVEFTMKYRVIMTHKVCHAIIGAQTVFSITASGVLFFWNHWVPDSYCDLEDVVPFMYIITLGSVIHVIILVMVVGVHYKMHQKAAESASRRNIVMEGQTTLWVPSHLKSAKVVVLVAGVYFICWTPYSLCLMVRVLQDRSSIVLDFFFQLTFPLSYANSLINPFIYAWKNKEIKNAVKWSIRRASNSSSASASQF